MMFVKRSLFHIKHVNSVGVVVVCRCYSEAVRRWPVYNARGWVKGNGAAHIVDMLLWSS